MSNKQDKSLNVGRVKEAFRIVVDYLQPLSGMIGDGHYDWIDPDIIAEHFTVSGEGKKEVEIVLFYFNEAIDDFQEVIAEMKKAGYRPAQIEELLALGASQPDLQKQFPIIALGSVWQNPLCGTRDVPYLDWDDVRRLLSLNWFEDDWDGGARFAAVRK